MYIFPSDPTLRPRGRSDVVRRRVEPDTRLLFLPGDWMTHRWHEVVLPTHEILLTLGTLIERLVISYDPLVRGGKGHGDFDLCTDR